MTTAEEQAVRRREYDALLAATRAGVAVMGRLVRARETRPSGDRPEALFADSGERTLPAAVWVALRNDDVDIVVEALTAVSDETFVLVQREEVGEGYRLRKVDDAVPVPVLAPLFAQLSAALDIPSDVLAVLSHWGIDDPRTDAEIEHQLERFGPAPVAAPSTDVPEPPPIPGADLVMTVEDAAVVLRLEPTQTDALATLVRRVGVRIVR